MTDVPVADAAERSRARDPERSVIVQAPAGSGKTELLMQRYLALLARVDEPEEILAVTFTRKAAAEMRQRIIGALYPLPDDKLLADTAKLAAAALVHAEERNWRLNEFPGRLRIRTLDAVNTWLTGTTPVSGDGTALGTVTERPQSLYATAARRTLELVTGDDALAGQIAYLLAHLDNRADRFITLFAEMLGQRDQWLPLISSGELDDTARVALEATLAERVTSELETLAALLPADLRADLLTILPYAAVNQRGAGKDDPVAAWHEHHEWPLPDAEALVLWRSLAGFALTGKKELRKTVNINNGFPPESKGGDVDMLQLAKASLATLAAIPGAAEQLVAVSTLPEPVYTDEQWDALQALLRVLPVVAAQLALLFRERGETDYIQIASEALRALEDDSGPTGLALRLDYRISHILIDEFQDTSRSQYRLLHALTEGWSEGDGRTLFVVGDPMQSIYRFRQADVALFLQLARHGIGQVRLEEVRLTSNFRSDPVIVDWVNSVFGQLMPAVDDPATGAVKFAPGSAVREACGGSRVVLHPLHDPPRVDEASAIATLVEQQLNQDADGTVGILVRTRSQARLLAPALRRKGIAFTGEGLERPGETSIEQDLIALTRALTHAADRTAWLALLRAPWCGLTLSDLEVLCGDDWAATVLEQLQDPERRAGLSGDGAARVAAFLANIEPILARRGTFPLRDWIEGAWQALGGPAALTNDYELGIAEQFLDVLDESDAGGDIAAAFDLHERLSDRRDERSTEARVHLLTLFKAKGLEYDTVILPGLDSATRGDTKPVLAWHALTRKGGDAGYLMAPLEAAGADHDPIHKLIGRLQGEQAAFERDRLLYVAATRARRELHAFFGLRLTVSDELAKPRSGSLLARLWPVMETQYADYAGGTGTPEARDAWVQPRIRRFPTAWEPPAAAAAVPAIRGAGNTDDAVEAREITYDWAGSDARRVGTVVHRCLQFMADRDKPEWQDDQAIRLMLREEGARVAELEALAGRVNEALNTMLADDAGRWILQPHGESASEYPVTIEVEGMPRHLVIDRTFVDADGCRWVIDYKTSGHEGGNLDAFLAEELRRYDEQLARYRDAMRLLEPERPVRRALYFPLLGILQEYPDRAPVSD